MVTFQSGRQINDTQMTVKIDHFALMVLNELLDLYIEADIGIHVRIDGLITRSAPMDPQFIAIIDQPDKTLNKLYGKVEKERMKKLRSIIKSVIAQKEKHRLSTKQMPSFMEPVGETIDREFALKGLQPEIENPGVLKAEPWVQDLNEKLNALNDRGIRFCERLHRSGSNG